MTSSVLVAMSGGVDSAVAALLLKEAGHEVVGATMCLGLEEGPGSRAICCGTDAVRDARAVCDRLGVAHHVLDFSAAFRENVIGRFEAGQAEGRTPNPCVDCNRFLKFGALLDTALALGFDRLATGHYAGIEVHEGRTCLTRGGDPAKDQSYFLYAIPRERLERILFPLARLTKIEVREIAARAALPVARKPESQDLCFARRNRSPGTARGAGPGPIVDREGRTLGRHAGLRGYTVGQRCGLAAGGGRRLYVLAKDVRHDRLVVGARDELRASSCRAVAANLLLDPLPARLTARIRHRGREVPCSVAPCRGGGLRVDFFEPVEAVAPGQAVVLYDGSRVAGGGTIRAAGGLSGAG